MDRVTHPRRRGYFLAATSIALALTMGAHPAHARGCVAQVDVHDRAQSQTLPMYRKFGRHWITGEPGHEYELRVRNCSDVRVLAVISVDGVNVISGETASPVAVGLRPRARRAPDRRRLAQEHGAHGRIRLHRPRGFVRLPHGPPARSRRDRRGALPRGTARRRCAGVGRPAGRTTGAARRRRGGGGIRQVAARMQRASTARPRSAQGTDGASIHPRDGPASNARVRRPTRRSVSATRRTPPSWRLVCCHAGACPIAILTRSPRR